LFHISYVHISSSELLTRPYSTFFP
jgi:hypothetical protein